MKIILTITQILIIMGSATLAAPLMFTNPESSFYSSYRLWIAAVLFPLNVVGLYIGLQSIDWKNLSLGTQIPSTAVRSLFSFILVILLGVFLLQKGWQYLQQIFF